MNGKALDRITDTLRRAIITVKSVSLRVLAGFAILALTALVYLGPYAADIASCLDKAARALSSTGPIDWQCFGAMLDDLREDGTAATVILAIAAAILASAWSSGSRLEE